MNPIQPIMPPMMKEEFLYQESFHKKNSDSMFLGKSAEHIVASYLLKNKITQGKEVYVTKYDFRFQSSGLKDKSVHDGKVTNSCGGGVSRRQYGPGDIDVFYEVIVTPYRELIFEIKAEDVPVGDDGYFKQSKSLVLDRVQTQPPRRGKDTPIDIRSMLISEQYDARLIRANQDFFFPPEQPTIMEFLS